MLTLYDCNSPSERSRPMLDPADADDEGKQVGSPLVLLYSMIDSTRLLISYLIFKAFSTILLAVGNAIAPHH